MRYDKIQKTTIDRLLDRYEKSKTFLGTNQVNQKFSVSVGKLFPKYCDDAEYDFFCDVNEALQELEKQELVLLQKKRYYRYSRAECTEVGTMLSVYR